MFDKNLTIVKTDKGHVAIRLGDNLWVSVYDADNTEYEFEAAKNTDPGVQLIPLTDEERQNCYEGLMMWFKDTEKRMKAEMGAFKEMLGKVMDRAIAIKLGAGEK